MDTFLVALSFKVKQGQKVVIIERGQRIAVSNWSQPGDKKNFDVVGVAHLAGCKASKKDIEAAISVSP